MSAPVTAREREPLSYTVRRSPYFERTIAAGALGFMVYNHTYMPIDYGRDPVVEYRAITEGVTLWDVGAERQAQLRGPDALSFADYLSPRDLLDLAVGRCRFTPVCDPRGQVMADCIVLRPFEDTVWYSHSDCDISLWAYGLALARGARVEVEEADVSPLQLQGPLAAAVLEPLYDGDLSALRRFDCAAVDVAGVPCVVSNTGWSKEAGFELYPLGSERCLELWDAIAGSGEPYGLLVTGPNITRAVEQGITDTQYKMNSGMTALEAGLESMLQLDGADFMGRDALVAERARGPRTAHHRADRRWRAVPVPRGLLARPRRRRQGCRRRALGGVLLRAPAQHRDRSRGCGRRRCGRTRGAGARRRPRRARASHPVRLSEPQRFR